MAVISVEARRKGQLLTFEWLGATEADTFQDIYLNNNVSDILIEAEGTFGGATVNLNGWVITESAAFTSVDPGGTAIALIADSSSSIRDAFPFFRPVHAGGTSETIDVRLQLKVVR